MRPLRRSLILLFLIGGLSLSALAQRQSLTDAQCVDLAGPVKSVSTETIRTDVVWNQPSGPALIFPVWCDECEFDPNGNIDGQGHVTKPTAEDAFTGENVRREVVGPLGNTEELGYKNGELWRHALFYGHTIDSLTRNGAGNSGKEGELLAHLRQTFDPKTRIEQFKGFDSSGSVMLTWTVKPGKLSSYWRLPGSPDTLETYQYHSDGSRERAEVRYAYLDAKRRNPQSVEWRDESGELLYCAYYVYEIDANRNWTHRGMWVWSRSRDRFPHDPLLAPVILPRFIFRGKDDVDQSH